MTANAAAPAVHISGRKIAGWLAQAGSFATTWAFIAALDMPGLLGFGIAVVVEVVLFFSKRLAFRDHRDSVAWGAVVIDMFLNAGGIWPYVGKLNHTPTWVMLSQALGLDASLGPIASLIISLVLGFILSVLPHRLLDEDK